MKKYHICDIMTWSRLLIFSVLMLFCAFLPIPLYVGLAVYILGILSDTDGTFARKYPYPDDGKYRWWRTNKFVYYLDEAADAVFGVFTLIFFIWRIDTYAGQIFLTLSLSIGFIGQFTLHKRLLHNHPDLLNTLLLLRRYLYFALIIIVLIMITMAAFPNYYLTAIGAYVAGAAFLSTLRIINWERLTKGNKN